MQNAESNGPSVTTEVKDDGKSVLLLCSPAYLQAVVLPALCTLSSGSGGLFTKETDNHIISLLSTPTSTYDKTGLIVNSKMKFSISTNSVPPSHLANVYVHLHNTTQKVHVQGNTKIGDFGTSAQWFTDMFLVPLFQHQSRLTNFDSDTIKQIHQSIVSAFSGAKNPTAACGTKKKATCAICGLPRVGRATTCSTCGLLFHKKCIDLHTCRLALNASPPPAQSVTTRKRPAPLNTTGVRSSSGRDVRQNLADIDSDSSEEGDQVSLPPSPQLTPPPNLSTLSGLNQLQASLGQLALSASSSPSPSTPPLQLSAPAVQASTGNHTNTSQQVTKTKTKATRKKNPTPPLTPVDLEIEVLKRAATVSQAKIASLEFSLKESKESNHIIRERIRLFEQRENDRLTADLNRSSPFVPIPLPSPQATSAPAPVNLPSPPLNPPPAPIQTGQNGLRFSDFAQPSPQHQPRPDPQSCPVASKVLAELGAIKCQLDHLQGSVSILLQAAPRPPPSLPLNTPDSSPPGCSTSNLGNSQPPVQASSLLSATLSPQLLWSAPLANYSPAATPSSPPAIAPSLHSEDLAESNLSESLPAAASETVDANELTKNVSKSMIALNKRNNIFSVLTQPHPATPRETRNSLKSLLLPLGANGHYPGRPLSVCPLPPFVPKTKKLRSKLALKRSKPAPKKSAPPKKSAASKSTPSTAENLLIDLN